MRLANEEGFAVTPRGAGTGLSGGSIPLAGGVEVVTPTGEIMRTGSITVKCVTGYDLTRLIVGSEGTLGVVTKIWAKLLPAPEHKESMLAVFDDMDDAARTVAAIIRAGIIPATLEFLDRITINAIEDFKKMGLPRQAEAMLLVETDGRKSADHPPRGRDRAAQPHSRNGPRRARDRGEVQFDHRQFRPRRRWQSAPDDPDRRARSPASSSSNSPPTIRTRAAAAP